MIKCEVIQEFTLSKYNQLKNIQRKSKEEVGRLFIGDIFECSKELAKYLTGDNENKSIVVKIIEVKPKSIK